MQRSIDLASPVTNVDHAKGADHAPVTVVEYGDFECPICKQAAPAVNLLLEHFAERVRVVWRHFPIETAHPHALVAAQAAEAAGSQGRFWEMHDLLFANQQHLRRRDLHTYAERLNLDLGRFKADLDDEIWLQRVREHIDSGRASHVRGTPTFYVNGRLHEVTFGMHSLVEAVDAALQEARDSHHRTA